MDNVLVYGKDQSEYDERSETVLKCIEVAGMILKCLQHNSSFKGT